MIDYDLLNSIMIQRLNDYNKYNLFYKYDFLSVLRNMGNGAASNIKSQILLNNDSKPLDKPTVELAEQMGSYIINYLDELQDSYMYGIPN